MLILATFFTLMLGTGVLFAALYVTEAILNSRRNRAPYVASRLDVLSTTLVPLIARYIPDTHRTVLVEPGAGLGHVATYLAKHFSWKQVIAIELRYSLYLLGRLRTFMKRQPVTYVRADLLSYPIPAGSVVYCYLLPPLLETLHRGGAFKQTLVFTLSFPIPEVTPTEVLPVANWQQQLYVYDFRSSKQKKRDLVQVKQVSL